MIHSLLTIGIIVYALLVPGYAIIHLFFKNIREKHDLSFRILASAVFSLSFLYVFAFILSVLPFSLVFKRIIAVLILLAPLLILWRFFHRRINLFSFFKKNTEIFLIGGSTTLFVIWICCIPWSAYPGNITHHMGDLPEYYVLAENIYSGNGFVTDYFIGDFWQGSRLNLGDIMDSPPIAARRPLVPFVTSFFYYVTGVSYQVINIMAAFLAALLPFAFYDFFRRFAFKKGFSLTGKKKRDFQLLALVICLIPSHFIYFSLGTITVFEMIAFFILMTPLFFKSFESFLQAAVMALAGGIVLLSRPEGIMIIMLVAVLFILPNSMMVFLRERNIRGLKTVLVFFVGIGLMSIPNLFIEYGAGSYSRNMWYLTLHYIPETGNFKSLYPEWGEFNSAIIRENYSEQPNIQNTLNDKIHSEIVSHPMSFVKWIIYQSWKRLGAISDLYLGNNYWMTAFLVLLIFLGPEWRFAFFLILFTIGFSLLSPILYARQAIVLSPLILMVVYSSFLRLSGWIFPQKSGLLARNKPVVSTRVIYGMVMLGVVCLVVLNTILVNNINRNPKNHAYSASLEFVREYTRPEDIIVSDYPQLIHLMTGRTSLGASDLLQILNPRLERYQPDYVLMTDSRKNKIPNPFREENKALAAAYISQYYEFLASDPRGNTLFFKHKQPE